MSWKHKKQWQDKYGRHPKWQTGGKGMRAGLFIWFFFMFGIVGILLLTGLGALIYLAFTVLTAPESGPGRNAVLFLLGGCGLLFVIPMLIWLIGGRGFVGVAIVADVMEASDKVASGDFSVRVPERGRRSRFSRLAHSFNEMTAALARSDEQRRNLTADVAHELRTPLHIIQGNLEGILDGVYEPSPDHIKATLEETNTLSRLVNDLHTLAQAEAGQLSIRHETVDVTDLLADVQTSFSGQAEVHGIALNLEFDDKPADLMISGDSGRLDQVLSNLVANSLHHTEAGGEITLVAQKENDRILIQVRDNGRGIPETDLPFIFDRFWRGDQARSRTEGASGGLGLAIVKQLVEAHDGRVSVQSTLGQGTIFTLDFPPA